MDSNDFATTKSEEAKMSSSSQTNHLEHTNLGRVHTAGGHVDDRTQPALPVYHRTFASPSPLGLISFATDIFLICVFGLQARGVAAPNVMVGCLIFYGGVGQFIAGIMEFITGNTFGATVFSSYAAFNLSYALIYLPGTGILAAYTDSATGAISPSFNQALSLYLWAWLIVTVVFTVAAMRSSWVLLIDLFLLDICLLLLACGYMVNVQSLLTAGYAFGLVVSFLSYSADWAGCAGLWGGGVTPIKLPTFEMRAAV
ncbi:GPR1/FUN34/yaaH family-domain-containing protein [Aspergillus transmontanensis]|uniref:GPR1/FUN34/yaaH family-domain-containing protein n=1 Tax=Aspergillus transmontanensis TaxID=1034304 RepID=A0A5N6VN48_9EURO|nr:GPR1/FUN34/yaaH family-domain-containing protein [Aspergillus transmontanensis]